MLNIHKYQRDLNLQQIAHIHCGNYEYLISSRGSYCKSESIVIVISGNWEYETGLLLAIISSVLLFLYLVFGCKSSD